jgi:hypothetical protein
MEQGIDGEPDIGSTLGGFYYSILVEIWSHEDRTFWTSVYVFLVAESILFVALLSSLEAVGSLLFAALLGFLGYSVSLMWMLVGSRWREALLLVNAQCRCLEKELFHKRLVRTANPEHFFPMYFTANKAIFHPQSAAEGRTMGIAENSQSKPLSEQLGEEEITHLIRSHYLKRPSMDPIRGRLLSSFSFSRIVTQYLPMVFLVAWGLVFCASLEAPALKDESEFVISVVVLLSLAVLGFGSTIVLRVLRFHALLQDKEEVLMTEITNKDVLDEVRNAHDRQLGWNLLFLGLGLTALGYTWFALASSGSTGFDWYEYDTAILLGVIFILGYWWAPWLQKRARNLSPGKK